VHKKKAIESARKTINLGVFKRKALFPKKKKKKSKKIGKKNERVLKKKELYKKKKKSELDCMTKTRIA